MKDRLLLLATGIIAASVCWASWHWWGQQLSGAVMVILMLAFFADNIRLRRQLLQLLVQQERRERREALQRLLAGLQALKKRPGQARPK